MSKKYAHLSNDDIERGIDRDEKREKGCGWAVVAGLVLEAVLTAIFPAHRPAEVNWYLLEIETWGPFCADALVALGVWGEIFFSGRMRSAETELRNRSNKKLEEATEAAAFASLEASAAHERAGRLEKEAAEARERTAELAKAFAGRHVTTNASDEIVGALKGKLNGVAVFIETSEDSETFLFSKELTKLFLLLGVKDVRGRVTNLRIGAEFAAEPVFGLYISGNEGHAAFVIDAFNNAGIPASTHELAIGRHVFERSYGGLSVPPARLHVYIGHKPPVEL